MRVRLLIALMVGLIVLLSVAFPLTVTAQVANWTGQVFNNTNFSGTAVSRTDASLASIDFGTTTAPASGVGTDFFSIRWTAQVTFPSTGVYRFTLKADDRASLFIAGSTTAAVSTSGVDQAATVDVNITSLTTAVQVDYVEEVAKANLSLSWALASSITGTATVVGTQAPVFNTGWSIQYFGGTTLSGPVLATLPIAGPQLNWGTGSPDVAVPADNFSARITSQQSYVPGVYRFEVRADDGVRLFINGQRIIDRWTASDGSQVYTADVGINGPSTIFIEYFELNNNAFVYFAANRLPDGSIPGVGAGSSTNPSVDGSVVPISATGYIRAGTLNVREIPSVSGRVLTKVSFGQQYGVVGTNADRSWYQLRVGQFNGWVKAEYVRISQAVVPVTAPTNSNLAVPNPVLAPAPAVVAPQAVSTGYTLSATANVVIRNSPSTQATRAGLVPQGAAAEILGRNSTNTWWYVTQNLQVGWISGAYVILPANMDLAKVPVLQP